MEEVFIHGRRRCVNMFFPLLFLLSFVAGCVKDSRHLEHSVVDGQDKKVETLSKECYMREQSSFQISASG